MSRIAFALCIYYLFLAEFFILFKTVYINLSHNTLCVLDKN